MLIKDERNKLENEQEQKKEQKNEIGLEKEKKSSCFLKKFCCSENQAISPLGTVNDFTRSFICHYVTCKYIPNQKRLAPNINDENNDYILVVLKEPNANQIMFNDISDIVREHLKELQSSYEIDESMPGFDGKERVIVVNENVDVEVIYERLIRLLILEPNLISRIKPKGSNDVKIESDLNKAKNFDEREEHLLSRKENLDFSQSPSSFANNETNVVDKIDLHSLFEREFLVVVHGEEGVGKRTFVNEFLREWLKREEDRKCLTFDCDCIEDDFRRFAKKLRINGAIKTINDLLHDLIFRISQTKTKLIFVFLNVDKFESIKLYMDVFQKLKSHMGIKIYSYYLPFSLA
jgi:hypothetical protein